MKYFIFIFILIFTIACNTEEDIINSCNSTPCLNNGICTNTKISSGGDHNCGLKDDSLYCWGKNIYGELALGDNETKYEPTIVEE